MMINGAPPPHYPDPALRYGHAVDRRGNTYPVYHQDSTGPQFRVDIYLRQGESGRNVAVIAGIIDDHGMIWPLVGSGERLMHIPVSAGDDS